MQAMAAGARASAGSSAGACRALAGAIASADKRFGAHGEHGAQACGLAAAHATAGGGWACTRWRPVAVAATAAYGVGAVAC
ncbi:hypothetical protein FNV43_RR20965 [Rhamnella rubrinervis]|uniref:Uncharacterized protein n=1 Tax=Rhamnella rubrinervis TaxID=2594499 RepID=A0A8K0GXG5_9ROSA|nr:hypothetical protein FNV43_RR20965 [Rhamnella rubrinervis]